MPNEWDHMPLAKTLFDLTKGTISIVLKSLKKGRKIPFP